MAHKKSGFISAFGIAFQVFMTLVNEILDQGGSDEDVRRIETDAELRKEVAALVIGRRPKAEPDEPVPTEMTIGDRTYEILDVGHNFCKVTRQAIANSTAEDGQHLLRYEDEIPVQFQNKVVFIVPTPGRRYHPNDLSPFGTLIAFSTNGQWIDTSGFSNETWRYLYRIIRRKK